MTTSVSHTAPERASADNRGAIHLPKNDYVSCTRLLRHAHHVTGGDITKAVDLLCALASDYGNAWSAIRVLRRVTKHPGCDTFTVERCGVVRFWKGAATAREVFTLIIGDLRFERSGDSMAVYDATMPWPAEGGEIEATAAMARAALLDRVDLPSASEFAFFRAAHAYCAAIQPVEGA